MANYDRRVSILRAALIDDGFAKRLGEPAEIGQRWADKLDLSDRERRAAAAVDAEVTTRFRFRWDELTSTLTGADMLGCEGVTYQIVGKPKEIGRRDGIEVTAASI